MAPARDFKEAVKARADRDPEFRRTLFVQAVECLFDGDVEMGRAMLLRDCVDATIGFAALGREVGMNPKSLHRTLGPRGNPQAGTPFPVVAHLREREGAAFRAAGAPAPRPGPVAQDQVLDGNAPSSAIT